MTTTTDTITLTGHDRHRILDDLWAVPGLGEHIDWIAVASRGDCHMYLLDEAPITALAAFHPLLDGPRAWTSQGVVYAMGTYRGVGITCELSFRDEHTRTPWEQRAAAATPHAKAAYAELLKLVEAVAQ